MAGASVTMAKKGGPSGTIRIDPALVAKARQVVAFRVDADGNPSTSLADYIDGLLRGPIEADHRELLDTIAQTHPPKDQRE